MNDFPGHCVGSLSFTYHSMIFLLFWLPMSEVCKAFTLTTANSARCPCRVDYSGHWLKF